MSYIPMRSETELKNCILDFAQQEENIRAVLLNGSRANPKVKPDPLQDFDIVFIVTDVTRFTVDHSWTAVFGAPLLVQLPDEMNLSGEKKQRVSFTYLMLFKDKNRIDLTLFPVDKLPSHFTPDSLTRVWLDKDALFTAVPETNDSDYHIQKPTEKQFLDTCNEFWWVSTYVVKGLLRNEIIYAKEMMETIVRPMFMHMIAWKVGVEQDFSVAFGKAGKFLKQYVSEEFYKKIGRTYSNFETEENWNALLVMAELFQHTANFVAQQLAFAIHQTEAQNAIAYLKEQHKERYRISACKI